MISPKMVKLHLGRIASWPWSGQKKAQALLEVLEEFKEWGLAVQRYGTSERRTQSLEGNSERFVEIWQKHRWCILKSKKPWNITLVVMMFEEGASTLSLAIEERFFEVEDNIPVFLALSKALYHWGEADYGCIAHEDEEEEKNTYAVGPHLVHGGWRLDQSLPGVYWANFFGPRYVEWFGAKKFDALTAFHKEQLADGGWLVLTRANPSPMRSRADKALERALVEQLRQDAFFDNRHPSRPTVTPVFARRIDSVVNRLT